MADQVSGQCKLCEGMQRTLYKRQGHIVKSSAQQTRLYLREIDLPWRLQFPSTSGVDQDVGITDIDVVMG